MLLQQLVEHHQFLAWDGRPRRQEDSRRLYPEEETELGATARREEIVGWLHRRSWVGCSLVACQS